MIRECLIGKINELSSSYSKFIVKKLNNEGLPILQNHIPLFYILPEDGSALLFNEISNIWEISKSSLSDIIHKYESLGLIKKCTCFEDKRSIHISLTPKGLNIRQKLEKMENEFLDFLLSDFNRTERENFEDSINKSLKNIKEIL
ncbi:MarR family winged helix-turn-helix transcriptional regulator [Clostridium sp. SHJSY1]|uniref:MarR family winged helix-turn-helix transcriptional regulator n=1 Tax=Clostridium sp. SHJSY1 TaxID=2942483 RepID=UPI0028743469|nr:MarR family winged helix-turn-helix transcriptional regulator [Clostridium sp. SHJSY1]MDS0524279.1 MarR family winged helix-turn-helix transcriptional regulator [Clostridium sp. SHJSY1]